MFVKCSHSAKYFQALQCLSKLLDDLARPDPLSVALAVTSTNHILINTEGKVHTNTFLQNNNNANTRQQMISENKVRWIQYFCEFVTRKTSWRKFSIHGS